MRRRYFIIGAVATAGLPLAGYAQQHERVRRIGVLNAFPENDPVNRAGVTAFAGTLERLGWVEGVLASNTPAVVALRQQTRTIPIVFVRVSDPVGQGFVQSLARPGGNITGFSVYDAPLMGKFVQLLKEVSPRVPPGRCYLNPHAVSYAASLNRWIEAAAPSLGMTATFAPVRDDPGIEDAIAALAREPGAGLISLPDSFTTSHRDVIIAAASRHRFAPRG